MFKQYVVVMIMVDLWYVVEVEVVLLVVVFVVWIEDGCEQYDLY